MPLPDNLYDRLKAAFVATDSAQADGAPALRLSATGTQTFASITITGTNAITFTAASAEIIPGATSLLFRNNADTATNLSITDAGLVTVRAGLVVTAGGATITAGNLTVTAGIGMIGGAVVAGRAFGTRGAVTTGTTQHGMWSGSTYGSDATVAGVGVQANIATTAAAYTMANAYLFYAGNPTKGSGSTITNAYGLYVESITAGGTLNYGVYINAPSGGTAAGLYNAGTTSLLDTTTVIKAGIATTVTTGLLVDNTTAATAGVTLQYSPSLVLRGQAWDSDDSVSRNAAWHLYTVPTSAATILGDLIFAWETPVDGALVTRFTFTSGGVLTTVGSITAVGVNAGAGNLSTTALVRHGTSGTAWDLGVGDGVVALAKNGNTAGVRISGATDGTIGFQTFAGVGFVTISSTAMTFIEALNIIVGTTTGTKFGTATTQKMGWWNTTPVIQGALVADASGGATIDAEARTAINTLLARMRLYGLIAT